MTLTLGKTNTEPRVTSTMYLRKSNNGKGERYVCFNEFQETVMILSREDRRHGWYVEREGVESWRYYRSLEHTLYQLFPDSIFFLEVTRFDKLANPFRFD